MLPILFKNLNYKSNEEKSEYLYSIHNKYVGDSSADIKIINELNIAQKLDLEIKKNDDESNVLIINVDGEKNGKLSYEEYGAILLALIDNLDEVQWNLNIDQNTIKVTTDDVFEKYGNIKEYGKTSEKLHQLLTNLGYYGGKEK